MFWRRCGRPFLGFQLGLYDRPFRAFYRGASGFPGLSPWARGVALSGLFIGGLRRSQGSRLGLRVSPFQGFWLGTKK